MPTQFKGLNSMETTLKFTRANIKGLIWREGTKQTLYWDTEQKGLGLRVTKGKKVFIYEQRLHGKTIRLSYKNELDLDLARAWATEQRAEFNKGNDPRDILKEKEILVGEKKAKAKVQADREKILVKDAWDDYIEYQKSLMPLKGLAKGKKWGERHLQDHLNMTQQGGTPHKRGKRVAVQGVLYPLLQLKLAEIAPAVLKDWLNKERVTRPNSARQGFQMFRTFWGWCAKHESYKSIVNPLAVDDDGLLRILPTKKSKKDGGCWGRNTNKLVGLAFVYIEFSQPKECKKWNNQRHKGQEFDRGIVDVVATIENGGLPIDELCYHVFIGCAAVSLNAFCIFKKTRLIDTHNDHDKHKYAWGYAKTNQIGK